MGVAVTGADQKLTLFVYSEVRGTHDADVHMSRDEIIAQVYLIANSLPFANGNSLQMVQNFLPLLFLLTVSES